MSRVDVVIFGATGATGRRAARAAARLLRPPLRWAVAGRSRRRLEDVLATVARDTGEDLSTVEVILADLSDEASLRSLCARAAVLVSCCGPYLRGGGGRVVRACLDERAHYVDVSGEPQFMDSVQLRYGAAARAAGVYVVNACGFDSVPNDMGVVFLTQRFDGTLNSVMSYLSIRLPPRLYLTALVHGVIHYGTWASIVHSFASFNEMLEVRKRLYPDPGPALKPELKRSPLLHRVPGGWAVPLPYPDAAVVSRTQRTLHAADNQRPVQFQCYFKLSSLLQALLLIVATIVLFIASRVRFTRHLLLRYPRVCSLGLVTREEVRDDVMNGTTFQFELRGRGWPRGADVETTPPEKTATVLVRGVNPAYGATVDALLLSVITILKERDRMPKTGGVYTTGVAFQNTSLIEKLNENNLTFELDKDER